MTRSSQSLVEGRDPKAIMEKPDVKGRAHRAFSLSAFLVERTHDPREYRCFCRLLSSMTKYPFYFKQIFLIGRYKNGCRT
jgi:hypothetical protein